MSVINVKIKKLYEDTIIPTRADNGSAGMDLYAHLGDDYMKVIKPHTTEIISVGFAMETPNNTYGAIFARSGLASKKGLQMILFSICCSIFNTIQSHMDYTFNYIRLYNYYY